MRVEFGYCDQTFCAVIEDKLGRLIEITTIEDGMYTASNLLLVWHALSTLAMLPFIIVQCSMFIKPTIQHP